MQISNEFNNFFVKVGKEISESIPNISKHFTEYMPNFPNIVPLNLQNTTAEHILLIVKKLAAKTVAIRKGYPQK